MRAVWIEQYLEGRLGEDERRRFETALKKQPELRRELADAVQIDNLLTLSMSRAPTAQETDDDLAGVVETKCAECLPEPTELVRREIHYSRDGERFVGQVLSRVSAEKRRSSVRRRPVPQRRIVSLPTRHRAATVFAAAAALLLVAGGVSFYLSSDFGGGAGGEASASLASLEEKARRQVEAARTLEELAAAQPALERVIRREVTSWPLHPRKITAWQTASVLLLDPPQMLLKDDVLFLMKRFRGKRADDALPAATASGAGGAGGAGGAPLLAAITVPPVTAPSVARGRLTVEEADALRLLRDGEIEQAAKCFLELKDELTKNPANCLWVPAVYAFSHTYRYREAILQATEIAAKTEKTAPSQAALAYILANLSAHRQFYLQLKKPSADRKIKGYIFPNVLLRTTVKTLEKTPAKDRPRTAYFLISLLLNNFITYSDKEQAQRLERLEKSLPPDNMWTKKLVDMKTDGRRCWFANYWKIEPGEVVWEYRFPHGLSGAPIRMVKGKALSWRLGGREQPGLMLTGEPVVYDGKKCFGAFVDLLWPKGKLPFGEKPKLPLIIEVEVVPRKRTGVVTTGIGFNPNGIKRHGVSLRFGKKAVGGRGLLKTQDILIGKILIHKIRAVPTSISRFIYFDFRNAATRAVFTSKKQRSFPFLLKRIAWRRVKRIIKPERVINGKAIFRE